MAHFCSSCGGSVEPGQKFCMQCGAPVIEATNAEPSTFSSAPQPQAQVITNGSPLSRAWADLKAEKGLIGRLVILAVLAWIPILNFVVSGYFLIWAADSALGRKGHLPEKFVTMPAFTLGFFSFVIGLVWGVVFSILSGIPLVGILAAIALVIIIPCFALSQMRLALFGSLGAAFEISKVWDLFKPNIGTTLIIFWAPQAVAVGCGLVISLVLTFFGGLGFLGFSFSDGTALAVGSLGLVAVLTVLGLFVMSFIAVAASLVSFRAFGYFVAETAPQWVRDGLVANPQARI